MNVQQLDMFYRFCQCKSVSKVARDLNLKQPTVSFHLKKLRDSVGITLYEQKGEEIVLTSAGAMLHQYAEKILRLVSETERVMKDYQSFNRGELRIGASTIPANYVLPPICSRFFSRRPNVQITLHVHSAPTIKKMVKEKEVDFGVISTQPMKDSLLVEKEIVSDNLVFVVSYSHEYAILDKLTRHDIEKVPIYIHSSGSTREMINEWAEKEKLSLNIRMELTSIEAIKKMVSIGGGGAILSKRAVQEEAQQNVLALHSLPDLAHNRSISLIYHYDRPISPLMQEFITDIFREV